MVLFIRQVSHQVVCHCFLKCKTLIKKCCMSFRPLQSHPDFQDIVDLLWNLTFISLLIYMLNNLLPNRLLQTSNPIILKLWNCAHYPTSQRCWLALVQQWKTQRKMYKPVYGVQHLVHFMLVKIISPYTLSCECQVFGFHTIWAMKWVNVHVHFH